MWHQIVYMNSRKLRQNTSGIRSRGVIIFEPINSNINEINKSNSFPSSSAIASTSRAYEMRESKIKLFVCFIGSQLIWGNRTVSRQNTHEFVVVFSFTSTRTSTTTTTSDNRQYKMKQQNKGSHQLTTVFSFCFIFIRIKLFYFRNIVAHPCQHIAYRRLQMKNGIIHYHV